MNATLVGAALAIAAAGPAGAIEIKTGNADLRIRWDNTAKYSAAFRVEDQKASLLSNANGDEGDRNFDPGLISNRFDLLSEFDVAYRNMGMRVSAAAWYDTVYNSGTDHDSPATCNQVSVGCTDFTDAVRDQYGRDGEILDAFAYANLDMGDTAVSLRAGRHTLIWGESLFYGANGVAAGQAPVDAVKALGVPSSQTKEILMPVTQVSGTIRPLDNLSLLFYTQFEWRRTRVPAGGSYHSDGDVYDKGGETLILGPGFAVGRLNDIEADDMGQWGIGLKYTVPQIDTDFGFYVLNYHDKTPQFYLALSPVFVPNAYGFAFAEDIRLYGVSATTNLWDTNFGAEVSYRTNTPLVSTAGVALPGQVVDADNPTWAVGKSLHAQISGMYSIPRTSLWDGGIILGEVAWNRRLSVTRNAAALDPFYDRDAWAVRAVIEPTWYQVISGVDATGSLGVGYGPSGKSSVIPKFNGGYDHGGDVSIGAKVIYDNVWYAGITYTHYFGDEDPAFKVNTLSDRDFVSLYVQRTF